MRLLRLSALASAAAIALTIAAAPTAVAEDGQRGWQFGLRHHFPDATAYPWFRHGRHHFRRHRRGGNDEHQPPVAEPPIEPQIQPAETGGDTTTTGGDTTTTGGDAVPTTGGGGPGGVIGGGDIVLIEAQ